MKNEHRTRVQTARTAVIKGQQANGCIESNAHMRMYMYMYIYVYIRREYVGRRGEREEGRPVLSPLSWQLLILKKMRS